jgi:hypothetical protein
VDELKAQLGPNNIPDAMFCSVGGGGLLVCPFFIANHMLKVLYRGVCSSDLAERQDGVMVLRTN